MRNNEERKAFIKDDANWEPCAVTDFTITEKLTYKGVSWYRVLIVEYTHDFDYELKRPVHRVKQIQVPLNSYYKVNEEQCAFERVSATEVIQSMQLLDKKCPDRRACE